MYESVELYTEAYEEMAKILGKNIKYVEMTPFEHSFIAGLLKQYKPQKVLEIGVASGVTTAMIVNCLNSNNNNSEMYSVDLSEKFYRRQDKKTGYLASETIKNSENIKHYFMLGNTIPFFIDDIGSEIDFLILDTAHVLPGEILDFLVCLPYLKDGCIVVLHDISYGIMNKYAAGGATRFLFSAVTGRKYFMQDKENFPKGYSNIGAFQISQLTRDNIMDVFCILGDNWEYCYDSEMMAKYVNSISKNYGDEYSTVLKNTYAANKYYDAVNKIQSLRGNMTLNALEKMWREKRNIYIYGAGVYGNAYVTFAKAKKLPIKAIVVSDDQENVPVKIQGVDICKISEIKDNPEDTYFILGVYLDKWRDFGLNLNYNGFYNVL